MADTPAPVQVVLGGLPFAVQLPDDFALLEELVVGSVGASPVGRVRVAAAMVAMCCPRVGRKFALANPRVTYDGCGFSPVAYGRAVYTWLHGERVTSAELVEAHNLLLPMLSERAYPREEEVEAALGKSAGPEAP